jgi:DNA-binding transcriptional MerR regulator
MPSEALKVGELARRTGLTIRTLHHYDEIGLLRPSLHTEAGHRVYAAEDIARLQQVISLRQLGFSLEEVGNCLDRPGFSPLEVMDLHVTRLREQIELQGKLCERLEAVAVRMRSAGEVSADEFLRTIEGMVMMEKLLEKYFTPEQLQSHKRRSEQIGEERVKQVLGEWPELLALVRAEMEKGTDPADAKVHVLAKRWRALVNEFSGGDPELEQAEKRLWQEQGDNIMTHFGMEHDPRLAAEYIDKAIKIAKGSA